MSTLTVGRNDVFYPGQSVRVKAEFTVRDESTGADTLTDPTTVTMKSRSPSGTVTSVTYAGAQVTKVATGIYYYDFPVTSGGAWKFQVVGTGTVVAAMEGSVEVRSSAFS